MLSRPLTRSMRADIGVMISASHNPFADNGIKLFGPDGYKLSDEIEMQIEALLENGHLKLVLGFGVEYSSTCPCSAALSRQANAERFAEDFAGAHPISTGVVRDWLASERGVAATPHAQRSEAKVKVELRPQFDELPLVALVDALEASLGTPVQTAVKREDEQAFAELNAANLMFCEDAARRVAAALAGDARVAAWQVRVAHFESLHPHDAVASVSGRNLP